MNTVSKEEIIITSIRGLLSSNIAINYMNHNEIKIAVSAKIDPQHGLCIKTKPDCTCS